MDTYTGKIIKRDVVIDTSRGKAIARRWVLDKGHNGLITVENIFNMCEGKVLSWHSCYNEIALVDSTG